MWFCRKAVVSHDIQDLPNAWLNVVPYREIGLMTARLFEKRMGYAVHKTIPMGLVDTAQFISEVFTHLNYPLITRLL